LTLLVGVIAIVVVFRGAYEQIGNTVALWADAGVDRSAGLGWTIPGTWFQALNPLLVFTITPLLLLFWARRGRTAHAPHPLRRMALGAIIVAAAYALLAVAAAQSAAAGTQAHWLWLVAFFVVLTTGELFILPTGLAFFGRLAPGALAATTMALWFSASFAGNLLAGGLGSYWTRLGATRFFLLTAAVAALAALLLRLVDGPARRTLGGPT
jgi:POT family proton-dependent oligopeptide transporter